MKNNHRCLSSVLILFLLAASTLPWIARSHQRKANADHSGGGSLQVAMTLLPEAETKGAVCLDGSPPAYHLHRGFDTGARSWLLQFEVAAEEADCRPRRRGELTGRHDPSSRSRSQRSRIQGGGWCNDVASCLERSATRRGSTLYMRKLEFFSGILSNDPSQNPDFYNWNRVKLRYCDGASFGGDSFYHNGTTLLHFRGQRIWNAIIFDLLPKGLAIAEKALLSGCSAGGLATFLHCSDFRRLLPASATVKCLSDAGFFLDVADVAGNFTVRSFFDSLVAFQGVQQNLDAKCTSSRLDPSQCFFPQYALPYIESPYFLLNAAYDVYQFHNIFVPQSADPHGHWSRCKQDISACTPSQISILQGYRNQMLDALMSSRELGRGLYINSCFAHCQSESQDTWFAPNSPRIHNKTIAKTVGDWYFEREDASVIDCAYPCDHTCHNLITTKQELE